MVVLNQTQDTGDSLNPEAVNDPLVEKAIQLFKGAIVTPGKPSGPKERGRAE